MIADIKFYLSLFLRRFHYFLLVAMAVSAVGITMAYTLPSVYEAEARLLVESPQIPGDLAESTVRAEFVRTAPDHSPADSDAQQSD